MDKRKRGQAQLRWADEAEEDSKHHSFAEPGARKEINEGDVLIGRHPVVPTGIITTGLLCL